jgi:8-oxo-dGTP diphosphatase
MTDRPEKRVSIALSIIENDGRLLMLQRRDETPMWDKKWELPGGKIEDGEDPALAACREIREETGLEVPDLTFALSHDHVWELPERTLHVHIDLFRGTARNDEVTIEPRAAYQYRWVTPDEALGYDLLEANYDMLKRVYADHCGAPNLG